MDKDLDKIVFLPVDLLYVGEDIRLDEDQEDLLDLSVSVKNLGILQPLIVRKRGKNFEVVSGRRRLSAARIVNLEKVPCIIRKLNDTQSFDVTLAENLHRRELSWIEVALAYDRMRKRGLNQTQIAVAVGKSQTQVSHVLKLLNCSAEIQARVQRREIGYITALDLHKRGLSTNPGGRSTRGSVGKSLSEEDAKIATHWRRRHDRLVAGINQVISNKNADGDDCRLMLQRLLKIDHTPIDEEV